MNSMSTNQNKKLQDALEDVEGWVKPQEVDLLYDLACQAKSCIVEIGCYRGKSTIALSSGSRDAAKNVPVYSIDPHAIFKGVLGGNFGPADRKAYYANLLRADLAEYAALINLPSQKVASIWEEPVDLLFIDGDHSYDAVKMDIELWGEHLLQESIVVFDDATNEKLGPFQVIAELIEKRMFESLDVVGKMHVLRKI